MNKCKEGKLTIKWFNKKIEKEGDQYIIGKEYITNLTMEEVCDILELDISEYPLIGGVQEIPKAKGSLLQKCTKHQFDFNKYDYFIGCYAET